MCDLGELYSVLVYSLTVGYTMRYTETLRMVYQTKTGFPFFLTSCLYCFNLIVDRLYQIKTNNDVRELSSLYNYDVQHLLLAAVSFGQVFFNNVEAVSC